MMASVGPQNRANSFLENRNKSLSHERNSSTTTYARRGRLGNRTNRSCVQSSNGFEKREVHFTKDRKRRTLNRVFEVMKFMRFSLLAAEMFTVLHIKTTIIKAQLK